MAMTDQDMAMLNKLIKQRKNKGPQTDQDVGMLDKMIKQRNTKKSIPCSTCQDPARCASLGYCANSLSR